MSEYLLFVDTEATDIPRAWDKPYAAEADWPSIMQLAWVIYTRQGQRVKAEDHYLRVPEGVAVSPNSVRVHGLTAEFVRANGQDSALVMHRLYDDLVQYQPLVVAHFMDLDFHLIGAGFYRAGLANPLPALPSFCTMKVTASFVRPAHQRHLPLGELYKRLFHEPLLHQHDARVDAQAAARCFFELERLGDITEQVITSQQPGTSVPAPRRRWRRWRYYLLGLLATLVLLFLLTWLYA